MIQLSPRLAFAQARGATIEVASNWPEHIGDWTEWYTDTGLMSQCYPRRIAENDAHYEYGSLSTAMRNEALSPNLPDPNGIFAAAYVMYMIAARHEWQDMTEDESRMSWLFFAEYLADEGL